MPMPLAWSFICSLISSFGDLLLALLWVSVKESSNNDTFEIGNNLRTSNQANTPSSAKNWWNILTQILTKLVIYLTINLVCLYTKYLIDLAQRNAFLETRRSIETRGKIARENDKQERLLLSLLPRFVALEIIADIAKEENHDKLLRNQFHKIYIHSYSNVRLVLVPVIFF